MIQTTTLENLCQILDFHPKPEQVDLIPKWNWKVPIPDIPIYIDSSLDGREAILDGRKRFYHLIHQAMTRKISWNFQVVINRVDCSEVLKNENLFQNSDSEEAKKTQKISPEEMEGQFLAPEPGMPLRSWDRNPEKIYFQPHPDPDLGESSNKNPDKNLEKTPGKTSTEPPSRSPNPSIGLLNPEYIAHYLLTHANQEYEMEKDLFIGLIRRIYRHLLNAMRSTHTESYELVELVKILSQFLSQKDISGILMRSEAWVSDAVAVGKLPLKYLAELEYRVISFSTASVLAHAPTEEERKLLHELNQELDVRSLKSALRYLIARPGFSQKKDALKKLLKMFSRKVLDVGGRAKLQLDVGIERSIRRLFQNRGRGTESTQDSRSDSEIPPQSLIFRLKITLDGEDSENPSEFPPEKVARLRRLMLESLKTLL